MLIAPDYYKNLGLGGGEKKLSVKNKVLIWLC